MIEDKELGLKIAESSDEAFWNETLNKAKEAIITEERNLKINHKVLELCEEQIKLLGIPNKSKDI